MTTHNFQWLQATREHDVRTANALGEHLENLLQAYSVSLDGKSSGVPEELLQLAGPISSESVNLNLPGPADAAAHADSDTACSTDEDDARPSSSRERRTHVDSSAAVIDTGQEHLSCVRLWNLAMQRYDVLQGLQRELEDAVNRSDDEKVVEKLQEEAQILADAIFALRRLGSDEARRKLDEYEAYVNGVAPGLGVGWFLVSSGACGCPSSVFADN